MPAWPMRVRHGDAMKVLTIHRYPHTAPGDFCWGVEGEIAVPGLVCASPADCGCDRSLCGINSHRASTTVMVRDLDLSLDDLIVGNIGSLEAGGWAELLPPDGLDEWARDQIIESVEAAGNFPVGMVLRPFYNQDVDEWWYVEARYRGELN
jgi:hypothetical protein